MIYYCHSNVSTIVTQRLIVITQTFRLWRPNGHIGC